MAYAVLDKAANTFVQLQYYAATAGEAEQDFAENVVYADDALKAPYQRTVLVMDYGNSVLTPEPLFSTDIAQSLVELVYGDAATGAIRYDRPCAWDMVHCYRLPAGLQEYTNQCFTTPQYRHYHTVLLQWLQQQSPAGDMMQVAFHKQHINVAVLRNGVLQLVQSYGYQSAEDVAYRLLAAAQQLQLDPQTVQVQVCGLVDEHSAMYSELQKYFLQTAWLQRPAAFQYDPVFDQYPAHFFTPIFLAACVS